MAVTLFFWKVLRSPRAKVLLNLCAAIAVTCALVILEGSARNKVRLPIYSACISGIEDNDNFSNFSLSHKLYKNCDLLEILLIFATFVKFAVLVGSFQPQIWHARIAHFRNSCNFRNFRKIRSSRQALSVRN